MEDVKIARGRTYDEDGNLIDGDGGKTIPATVWPKGASRVEGFDTDGHDEELTVSFPAGTDVHEGDEVIIRGNSYIVQYAPFDWNVTRRAACKHKRPGVTVDVKRGEG